MQAAQKLLELRQAVHDLQERGLLQGAKWAAEHAVALQQARHLCMRFYTRRLTAWHAIAGRCRGAGAGAKRV
jgi:hypothetical protein